jgi:hypothetical protein
MNELPDDVLLEIFSFYLNLPSRYNYSWHVLVHVCRRWRCLVFASPRHLHLRLILECGMRVKEALEFWPEFPIVVLHMPWHLSATDAIAALEQHDRVCEISIEGEPESLCGIISAMKKPFPSLVKLIIVSDDVRNGSMIPDSFLGGSAPRLQSLELYDIKCPAIEKLLLSTPNLVSLSLIRLPPFGRGYISPEAMVNGLSVLTRLKSLHLSFHSPRSQSQQAIGHPSPFARVVLPTLTYIYFFGENEYLGDIVSRIDTPLLASIAIMSNDPSVSATVTPPLRDFIRRTENFGACSQIDVDDPRHRAKIEFFRRDGVGV